MNIRQLTQKYFTYFQKKKLDKLEEIFDENIQLIDPGNKIKGKTSVLNFNKQFFKKFKTIKIQLIYQAINKKNNISISYIKVKLNKKSFDIVDLLEMSKNKKIKKILAFKQ
tara:strand:+ start:105 stop:437 length:333 start_codon:yes stop_codon:yes gene_type:complete